MSVSWLLDGGRGGGVPGGSVRGGDTGELMQLCGGKPSLAAMRLTWAKGEKVKREASYAG